MTMRPSWRWAGAGRLVCSILLSLAGVANAAPNALCPGSCEGTGQPCGAASDCDGACALSPTCLPAGYEDLVPLIQRVVPEGPGGLNDARVGWACGLLTCEPAADHLAVRSSWGSSAAASKDIALTPGRYLLLADLAVEDRTWGALSIVSDGVSPAVPRLEAWTESYVGSAEGLAGAWERASLFFEVPPGHRGPIQVRLHGDGPGRVAIRRVVLLELVPHGIYLRVRYGDAMPAGFEVSNVRVPTDAGGIDTACVDACRVGAGFDGSGWLDLAALAASLHAAAPNAASTARAAKNRMTLGLRLEACGPDGCVPRAGSVQATFELAYAPDSAAIVWRGTRTVNPERVGLVVPHAPGAIHPFALRAAFLQELLTADLAQTGDTWTPSWFKVGATTAPLDRYDAGPVDPRAPELLAGLGLNVAGWFERAPSAATRLAALDAGLVHRIVGVPDVLATYESDFDLATIEAHVRAALALDVSPLGADLAGCTDTTCVARLSHTPRTYVGAANRAAFVAWLRQRGETAADLGLERLDDAIPLDVWPPGPIPTEPRAARFFVQQVTFALVADARALGRVKAVVSERASVPIGLAMGRRSLVELRIAAEEAGLSALFADAASGPGDDCDVSRIGAFAQLVASVAEPGREGAEARGEVFALAARIEAGHAASASVLVSHAARGFTWLEHDGYGPHDASPTAAHGGLGDATRVWMDRVRAANRDLAAFEPWLEVARRPYPPFVILAPESDAIASGDSRALDADALGWHAALTHGARPVGFMLESDVAQGLLEHPVYARRLLVVTRKHVSHAAWRAIERWVEAGNTLVLGPDLAAYDEFGQAVPDRTTWLGAVVGEPRRGGTTLRWSGALGVSSVLVPGEWREVLALIGTPIALSTEDRPVVVRVPRGRGRVIVSGVQLGATYRLPETTCDPRRPEALPRYTKDFSAVLRDAMVGLTGVTPTVRSDDPRVWVTRLTTDTGRPFVLVIPWLPTAEPVSLHIAEAAGCPSVREEIEGVELPMTFGTLFATLTGPAILTWPANGCARPVEEQPEVAEPAPPQSDDGCGVGATCLWWGLIALAARRRPSRRPCA